MDLQLLAVLPQPAKHRGDVRSAAAFPAFSSVGPHAVRLGAEGAQVHPIARVVHVTGLLADRRTAVVTRHIIGDIRRTAPAL